jgi:hypothetical protein
MSQMKVDSAVVSQVVPVGFADLAQAADKLPGQVFTEDRIRLTVHGRAGTGLAGAIRFAGTLRTTSALLPSMKVEVVVSPWSADRSEVAIHPMSNLGPFDSLRANRFFKAGGSILPEVIDRLTAEVPVEQAPATLGLAA